MAGNKKIPAGEAFVEISLRDKLTGQLNKLQDKLKVTGAAFQSIGAGLAGVGGVIMAAFIPAVTAASRLEETMNKFNVVFSNNSTAVKEWSDNFASQVGRSKEEMASFLASTQDLFVPLGFDATSAEAFSKQLVALTVDVASFNNKVDSDVLRDFHAALTGGGETVKKYGVLLNVATTNLQLMAMGLNPKAATEQEKVQARLNILMEATTAAQGDAIRSSGSWANQVKRLMGNLNNMAAAIGGALLPVITPLVNKFAKAVKLVADWASANKTLVATLAKVAGVVTVVGVTLIALGTALKAAALAQTILLSVSGPAGWAALLIGVTAAAAATIALNDIMDKAAAKASDVKTEMEGAADAVEKFAKSAGKSKTSLSDLLQTVDDFIGRMDAIAHEAGSLGLAKPIFDLEQSEEAKASASLLLDQLKAFRESASAAASPVGELRKKLEELKALGEKGILPDGFEDELKSILGAEIGKETGLTDALKSANDELDLMLGNVSEIDVALRKFIAKDQLADVEPLRKVLEDIKAAKAAAEAASRSQTRLAAIATSAIEETRTPEERFERRLGDLQSVRGKIGESTFAKAVNQAAERMQASLDGVKRAASFSLDTAANLGLNLRSAAGVHAQANLLRGVATGRSVDQQQLDEIKRSRTLLARIEKAIGEKPKVVESPV